MIIPLISLCLVFITSHLQNSLCLVCSSQENYYPNFKCSIVWYLSFPVSARSGVKMRREVELQEVDWTAFPKPSEEMQSSWLLQHSPKPKKKTVRKHTCAWTLAFIGIGVVMAFSMTIRALTHRHHYQQQAPDAYNMALHTGLKFFNSQRCKSKQTI